MARLPRQASRPADVQTQIGEPQLPFLARLPAPQAHPDAGQQLAEGERFDEVIVRPRFESVDAVGYGVARGQHDHRQLLIGQAQAANHLQPVEPRHHDVEHGQIGPILADGAQRFFPVSGQRDLESFEARPRRREPRISSSSSMTST